MRCFRAQFCLDGMFALLFGVGPGGVPVAAQALGLGCQAVGLSERVVELLP